ncbi:hypothetical protein CRG98_037698 [Punica granatum]|uniref:Retrotransposon Copia-like N-terminal domain-containing protein n=1 Tax=Punica granatum TaxID=22663 RepID=A0A2I0ID75_PUNGR|nr:hypothetical protein CRG98_037698 [Punica granatum]
MLVGVDLPPLLSPGLGEPKAQEPRARETKVYLARGSQVVGLPNPGFGTTRSGFLRAGEHIPGVFNHSWHKVAQRHLTLKKVLEFHKAEFGLEAKSSMTRPDLVSRLRYDWRSRASIYSHVFREFNRASLTFVFSAKYLLAFVMGDLIPPSPPPTQFGTDLVQSSAVAMPLADIFMSYDNPGTQLISCKLNGRNYNTWS